MHGRSDPATKQERVIMGDRTNIVIAYKSTEKASSLAEALAGAIVLYWHWGGYDAGPSLAKALAAAHPRWDDESYAARIIVSRIIGKHWNEETGFGLYSGELGDNEHSILLVDLEQKVVRRFGNPGYLNPDDALNAAPTHQWTFLEFANMKEGDAREAHLGKQED